MGDQNSQWYLDLAEQMIVDLYAQAIDLFTFLSLPSPRLRVERERDLAYLKRRVSGEGLGFLTTALPSFGKWVDGILGCKAIEPPHGFKPYMEDGRPRFLHMIVDIVSAEYTDPSEELLDRQAHVIRTLRTFLFCLYKLEVPYSRAQEMSMLDKFCDIEESLEDNIADSRLLEYMRQVISVTLNGFFIRDYAGRVLDDIRPKHGPGAVATGERLEQKWKFSHLYESLHQRFPYYDFMFGNRHNGRAAMLAEYAAEYRAMIKVPTPTAKLVLVPKDSRGPRLISSEPLEVQYMQQAVARKLVRHLERCSEHAGHINFTDQSINQNLAIEGSKDGYYATIDMSDASDRVSRSLVKSVFPEEYWEDLDALRSTHTRLPQWYAETKGINPLVRMKKYAPMGSALCFPVESVIFYAACVASLIAQGMRYDVAASRVYVFGDDIILPAEYVTTAIHDLSSIGLVVNSSKSYWKGAFRESCGVDAWKGRLVTPIRIRKTPPINARHGTQAMAHAAYCSHMWEIGMCHTSEYIVRHLRSLFGFVPDCRELQPFLCVHRGFSEPLVHEYPGFKRPPLGTSYPSANVWALRSLKRSIELDSWRRLLRFFSEPLVEDPSTVVVPDTTLISRRRSRVYLGRAGTP